MYRITTTQQNGSSKEICRSKNYRLAKRKARWFAASDIDAWFGKFTLYKDDVVEEEGAMISSRISWNATKG